MLLIDARMLRGDFAHVCSAGLLVLNVGMMVLMASVAAKDVMNARDKDRKLMLLHDQIVIDKHEDKEKFAKAWTSLVANGLPGDDVRMLDTVRLLSAKTAGLDGKQPSPTQSNVKDVDELLEEADDIKHDFHASLRAIVVKNGGEYLQGPNKTRGRAIEKIENDYDGDHTRLVDVVRASGVFTTLAELAFAVSKLVGGACMGEGARMHRRLHQPPTPPTHAPARPPARPPTPLQVEMLLGTGEAVGDGEEEGPPMADTVSLKRTLAKTQHSRSSYALMGRKAEEVIVVS